MMRYGRFLTSAPCKDYQGSSKGRLRFHPLYARVIKGSKGFFYLMRTREKTHGVFLRVCVISKKILATLDKSVFAWRNCNRPLLQPLLQPLLPPVRTIGGLTIVR